ncbi:hypothetical protein LIER_41424 [Lithospermum erythrorhizon]|uniref:Uncharacterized protein n=1 Tax=Lithospermum erythrorhizon TaxID=34254 RepID=A0AAV3RCD0_LITER
MLQAPIVTVQGLYNLILITSIVRDLRSIISTLTVVDPDDVDVAAVQLQLLSTYDELLRRSQPIPAVNPIVFGCDFNL